MDRGLDTLAVLSVLLGIENLQENRQQSAQQEKILQDINLKFDRLERLVKEMKKMKIIKCLVEDIQEELEGAEHYAKLATQYKDEDRELADVYAKLANVELDHVDALHAQAVRMIKAQKAAGAETPAPMQAVWDWEHGKMVDTTARIKTMLSMYRGS